MSSRKKQPSMPGFVREDINLVNTLPVLFVLQVLGGGGTSFLSRDTVILACQKAGLWKMTCPIEFPYYFDYARHFMIKCTLHIQSIIAH